MFNPNIFYLPVMPAQIYGRHILPKFRFTFMKNVNIQNSLLRTYSIPNTQFKNISRGPMTTICIIMLASKSNDCVQAERTNIMSEARGIYKSFNGNGEIAPF